MTLKIEDVEAGDWLTCVDADDSPLMEGHDYQAAEIINDAVGICVVGHEKLTGPVTEWRIDRFIRRPFRVGDVVEFVADSKWHLAVAKEVDACAKFITVSTSSGEVFQDVHFSKVKLITPAHLVAKTQPKPEQSEPSDAVNHPSHYTSHPSGVECIAITQHMNFCRGNAMKYIWRADKKGDAAEDLRKAVWYLNREIERLEKQRVKGGAK